MLVQRTRDFRFKQSKYQIMHKKHFQHCVECVVQVCESRTEILLLVAVVATVVLHVAEQASVDAVAVVTPEFGWHFTGDVDW